MKPFFASEIVSPAKTASGQMIKLLNSFKINIDGTIKIYASLRINLR